MGIYLWSIFVNVNESMFEVLILLVDEMVMALVTEMILACQMGC